MPKLPENWRADVIAKLNEKVPGTATCPACGKQEVRAAGDLVTSITISDAMGLILGGSSYPQLHLICNNCGFTRAFNYMILMGDAALAPDPPETPEPAQTPEAGEADGKDG